MDASEGIGCGQAAPRQTPRVVDLRASREGDAQTRQNLALSTFIDV